MTMTRDKIERMRADMQGVGDHCAWAFRVADLRPLLALAERALKPQGHAHANPYHATFPQRVWLNVGDCNETELAEFSSHHEITWADSQIDQFDIEYVRADLASQLALPAGPVPEGRTAIALCDEYGSAVTAFTAEEVQAVRHAALEEAAQICDARRTTAWAPGLSAAIRALKSSPAVAQPVADEREVITPFSVRKDADGIAWLYFAGGMVSLNNIANESGPLVREAMSRAIKALKGGA